MPNENEIILEAILQNQDEKSSETNDLLEKVLEITADNNHEDLLDKQLELQAETLEATKKIAEKKDGIDIEINGASVVGYTGPEGRQGDIGPVGPEPSSERLIELITPLIPPPQNGKDADEDEITRKVLEEIVPMIPTPESVASLVVVPEPIEGKPGAKGEDGKHGKPGTDGSPDTPEQVKEKLLKVGLNYSEIKDAPNIDMVYENIQKVASKTVSLRELDDVNLDGLTQTNGKYNLGEGGSTDISVRVYQTGVTALTASWVACAFAAEDFDTDTMHDNATNNTRITFTTAGKYCVGGGVSVTGATDGDPLGARIRLNGSTVISTTLINASGALSNQGVVISTIYDFIAGDYIELQGRAPTYNSSGDIETNFWAYKIN